MKKCILQLLICLPVFAFAQQNLDEKLIDGCRYLQVAINNDAALAKPKIAIIYGNAQLMDFVKGDDDKKFYFPSWGHAYDYLDKQGWVFLKNENFRMNGGEFYGMIMVKKE